MGKFIPVEPEKWAEMVKAQAEVERLEMEQRLKAVPVEAKLLDRIAELKAEVEELTGLLKASTYYNTSDEVTRLKAEVERLTKAGDAMADRLMYQGYPETVPAWNAAKEGEQP